MTDLETDSPSKEQWYYYKDSSTHGPFDALAMRQLREKEIIAAATPVWKQEFGDQWKRWDLTELQATASRDSVPPKFVPPKSALRIIGEAVGWYLIALVATFFVAFVVGVISGFVVGKAGFSQTSQGKVVFSGFGAITAATTFAIVAINESRNKFDIWGDGKIGRPVLVGVICICIAVFVFIVYGAALLNRPELLSEYTSVSWWFRIPLWIGLLVAPIGEELFFRGWLWGELSSRWSLTRVAAVTCLFWLLVHLPGGLVGPILLVPVGAAITFVRYYTGSVRAGMIVHYVNNVVAIIVPWLCVWWLGR